MLTRKEISGYLNDDGAHCPKFGSDNLVGGSWYRELGEASQEMSCGDCDTSWRDVFKLNGVAED